MYAAQSPCAIWRKQTLRVQSIACTNAAPFYRGERRQTHPVTNPALAASPTLLRIKASETESYNPQTRDNIMTLRVNLSRQTCRNPSAKAGTHNHRAQLFERKPITSSLQQNPPRRMGPCFRRDDSWSDDRNEKWPLP